MSTIMSPWCLKVWTSINHQVTRIIERLFPFDLEMIAHDWQPTIKNEKEYKNLSGLLIKKLHASPAWFSKHATYFQLKKDCWKLVFPTLPNRNWAVDWIETLLNCDFFPHRSAFFGRKTKTPCFDLISLIYWTITNKENLRKPLF